MDNRKFVRIVESENDLIQFNQYIKKAFNKHIDVKTYHSAYKIFPKKVIGFINMERFITQEYIENNINYTYDYREVIYIMSYEEYIKTMNGGRLL